ncbi:MAG: hypothetical protein JWR00_1564 [Rubritepida sp.]|nr:hypothetical protein [Rubritepida sp.]
MEPQPEAFVAFFARQSNNSVNGCDPAEPLFHTDSDWERTSQRLTHEAIATVL